MIKGKYTIYIYIYTIFSYEYIAWGPLPVEMRVTAPQWRRVYGGTGRHVPHQKFYSFTSLRHGASSHFLAKLSYNSNDFLGELLLTMECENCIRTKEIIKQANLSPISINSLN